MLPSQLCNPFITISFPPHTCTHIHTWTHMHTHTHREPRKRQWPTEITCSWKTWSSLEECNLAWQGGESWRTSAWRGPGKEKQADLFHRTQEKLRNVRHYWTFSPLVPTHLTFSGQFAYPSHIPVGNRGLSFWGDCTRDLGSGAQDTVRTGAFTEDSN